MNFEKSKDNAKAYVLNLSQVHKTAEVFLNGKKLATLIGPTFQLVIPASELKQSNELEIVVANLMANLISYMYKHNLPWKIFYYINMPARKRENIGKNDLFDASSWQPLPSGPLGPVRLTQVSYDKRQSILFFICSMLNFFSFSCVEVIVIPNNEYLANCRHQ